MKTLFTLALLFCLLVFHETAAFTALEALKIWGYSVVPSLFPYMVLCQSLCASLMQKPRLLFALSPALGLLGGSPSGSAALNACIHAMGRKPEHMLSLCALAGTISPMFFLGPLSTWLGSSEDGLLLLIAHLFGTAVSAAALYPVKLSNSDSWKVAKQTNTHQEPVKRSIDAILHVGGCIVFFSVAVGCVKPFFPSADEQIFPVLHAVFEVSGGMRALIDAPFQRQVRLMLLCAASGLSGCSILSQNLFFLSPFGIGMKHLFLIGLLRAGSSALLMAFLC